MPRTVEGPAGASAVLALAHRIASPVSRRLFAVFCREVCRFSDGMRAEASAFDITFRDASGFSIIVSPFPDLFLVSLGDDRSSDIRVSSIEGFCFALDSALRRHLAAASHDAPAHR
jgi:hypothetical protein